MKYQFGRDFTTIATGFLLALTLTGCAGFGPRLQDGQPVTGAVGKVVNLDQGWRDDEQQRFYFTSQGSQLLPYDWFLVLEQADSTDLFRSDENMERQGWLLAKPTRRNPDGLPVGFVEDVDLHTKRSYLGLTCAACHTTQIQYHDTAMRIDGGPTQADADGFLTALTQATSTTLASSEKFNRFASRISARHGQPTDASQLRAELQQLVQYLNGRAERNAPTLPGGHARLDAFGNILNEVLARGLGIQTNARPCNAPVSYPFLWDAPFSDRVQWNGVAENNPPKTPPGLGALGRNVGEALGVFAKFDIQPTTPPTGYASSVNLVNLGLLENWLGDLWSPRWPEQFLPPLDPVKVKRGEALYHRAAAKEPSCAKCHEDIVRDNPKRRFIAQMTPLYQVGTDPTMATNFVTREAATGPLEGTPVSSWLGKRFESHDSGGDILSSVGRGVILRRPVSSGIAGLDGEALAFHAPPASLLAYKARPLNGIWATAPYLHNGSVPNLWELLQKPADRVKTFSVGSRDFDPVNVGFLTTPQAGHTTLLDTRIPGNSNAGHTWGTELSDAEKWDLIEYLKSL